MNKLFYCILVLLFTNETYSQIMPDEEMETDWIASRSMGFITVEVENSHKTVGVANSTMVGKEFYISDLFILDAALEYFSIKTDHQLMWETVHQTYSLIQLPVLLNTYIGNKNKTAAYLGLGGYASYMFSSRAESIVIGMDTKETGLGFNSGVISRFGITHVLTNRFRGRLGIRSQTDFAQAYKAGKPAVKLTGGVLFEIGFGVQL